MNILLKWPKEEKEKETSTTLWLYLFRKRDNEEYILNYLAYLIIISNTFETQYSFQPAENHRSQEFFAVTPGHPQGSKLQDESTAKGVANIPQSCVVAWEELG